MSVAQQATPLDSLSADSLRAHMRSIRDFYRQFSIDPDGGFFQSIAVDGSIRADRLHHLVSSCRITVNFARSAMFLDLPEDLEVVRHGLDFIETAHRRADGQGYHWLLQGSEALYTDQYCYGYAFLLLTYASAYKAGIDSAKEAMESVHHQMQTFFWDDSVGLFADQYSIDNQELSSYRGQNANMHATEALIAAYDASGDHRYLDQAQRIAENIVERCTVSTQGHIWEHYDSAWSPDFDYNRDDPKNLYKPWGYQSGHFTEWAKLLLIINFYRPADWMREQARFLLNEAWEFCWDEINSGLHYGFAPDGSICDSDKYFWVQAETLAALAIANRQGLNLAHKESLIQLEKYVNKYFIANNSNVWFRMLSAENKPSDEWVALPGAKCDYHTLGAYHDILRYGLCLN